MRSRFLAYKRAALGHDGPRLPPGQVVARGWPILTYEPDIPDVDRLTWRLRVCGLVEQTVELSWDECSRLPHTDVEVDIHCVTRWSKLGMRWSGVAVKTVAEVAGVMEAASHVVVSSVTGYAANLTRSDVLDRATTLIATEVDGAPLAPEHGGPARLLAPHLYFWKPGSIPLFALERVAPWSMRSRTAT